MSEDQSRSSATRGRSAGRGGRGGGHSNRAATRSNKAPATNGDSKHEVDSSLPTLDDGGDVRELKQKYGSKIGLIKEMFSDWSDIDILYALQEADGDESLAVTRIADGMFPLFLLVAIQDTSYALHFPCTTGFCPKSIFTCCVPFPFSFTTFWCTCFSFACVLNMPCSPTNCVIPLHVYLGHA